MPRITILNSRIKLSLFLSAIFVSLNCNANSQCVAEDENIVDITTMVDMTFEEVMGLSVTSSVNKKAQCVNDSAAAVFVISNKDIQRSGVTTIADALRLAPGVQVARYNSHAWAVTMRGFNGFFSPNLLVMIDGRSVYNAEFSGVYWDITDTLLADIERIEVIRGPGGTLWGANAVNGVINIITKKAKDTQGGLLIARAGDEERVSYDLRYGGKIDEASNTYYRVYAKGLIRDAQKSELDYGDHWSKQQLGFKVEGEPDDSTQWTVQGDTYAGKNHETPVFLNAKEQVEGANVLARLTKKFSADSELRIQAYFDYAQRNAPSIKITDITADIDIQHRYRFSEDNEFMWGFDYRSRSNKSVYKIPGSFYDPVSRNIDLFSIFLQDEVTLIPETLRLTLGSKFEHNVYTGFEYQPNVRLLWNVDKNTSAWAAFSRAVRTPSRVESDISITIPLQSPLLPVPVRVEGKGNRDLKAENTLAYEVGFRQQIDPKFEYDVAAFYNHYNRLRGSNSTFGLVPDANSPVGVTGVLSTQGINNMAGNGYGVEIAATWKPFKWWQLKSAYTYTKINLRVKDNAYAAEEDLENRNPRHQVSLFSNMAFANNTWGLDAWLRYTDKLATTTISPVNDYLNLDARLFWHPIKQVELSFVGQNLITNTHYEFPQESTNPLRTAVQRGFYGQIRWEF